MNFIKKVFLSFGILFMTVLQSHAINESMSDTLSFTILPFTRIAPITSPVLTANITDRTGNLYAPLNTKFRVITNARETQTLYLKSNVVTESGYEESMFQQGGQVYIAFANISKPPTSSALANCKIGSSPKDSPGVVAYPVLKITGAEHKFISGKNKYEVYVNNGTTDVGVNIGSNVLAASFAANDKRGFYQAILSLTESDI